MKTFYSKDPVYQSIHEQLNRIQWIISAQKPYPKDSDPANEKVEEKIMGKDIFSELFGKGV